MSCSQLSPKVFGPHHGEVIQKFEIPVSNVPARQISSAKYSPLNSAAPPNPLSGSARRHSWYLAVWVSSPQPGSVPPYDFFFAAAALALAAFFLLLLIMTTPRKEPTTAEARRMRMTGMRTAQTRGGKKFWRG